LSSSRRRACDNGCSSSRPHSSASLTVTGPVPLSLSSDSA
jgi:hypothetical protein